MNFRNERIFFLFTESEPLFLCNIAITALDSTTGGHWAFYYTQYLCIVSLRQYNIYGMNVKKVHPGPGGLVFVGDCDAEDHIDEASIELLKGRVIVGVFGPAIVPCGFQGISKFLTAQLQ